MDETTSRILDAAGAHIRDFGFRRTSMEDVARRARVGRATLYRRFASRDALIEGVMMRELQRYLAALTDTVANVRDLEERVVEGFVTSMRFIHRHWLGRLLLAEPDLLQPFLASRGGDALAICREYMIGQLRHEKALRAKDIPAIAETLIRITLSFLLIPDSCVRLGDETAIRAYARRCLAPIVRG